LADLAPGPRIHPARCSRSEGEEKKKEGERERLSALLWLLLLFLCCFVVVVVVVDVCHAPCFADTIRMWDSLFAQEDKQEYLLCICVSMVLNVKPALCSNEVSKPWGVVFVFLVFV
jgi:hypothetical protein